MLIPVILAGGSGKRLSPISTSETPKPFIDLLDCGATLFEQTLQRAQAVSELAPIIICSQANQVLVETILAKQVIQANVLLEPCTRNTAPAIASATLFALNQYGSDCQLLFMPADHYLPDLDYFIQRIQMAEKVAEQHNIVVFGITPTYAETAYGYIEQDSHKQFISFHEKPVKQRAEYFFKSGNFLWNSGFFLSNATLLHSELANFSKAILNAAEQALAMAQPSSSCTVLADRFTPDLETSIDYAIMEKSTHLAVMQYDSLWSDLGTWHSLYLLWPKSSEEVAHHHALQLTLTPIESGYKLEQYGVWLANV